MSSIKEFVDGLDAWVIIRGEMGNQEIVAQVCHGELIAEYNMIDMRSNSTVKMRDLATMINYARESMVSKIEEWAQSFTVDEPVIKPKMTRGVDDATTCELNGWGVGTILESEEDKYSPVVRSRFIITYIGESIIIGKWPTGERVTTLTEREWREVKSDDV